MENTEKNSFITRFADFAARFGNLLYLRTLRDAFATIMPLYILAGIAVLLNNTVFTWIFSGDTLTTVQYWGNALVNGTLNISGLLIAATIGYCLSVNREFSNPLSTAVVAVAGVVVMMPMQVELVPVAEGASADIFSGVLTYNNLGTGGMFGGILIGLLISELYIKLSTIKQLQINLGNQVPPAVAKSFNVLIPVMLSLAIFAIIATLISMTGTDLISIIKNFIQTPLKNIGTSLWGTVILYTLGNLLWLFGIHQSVIYSSILEPLLIINIQENIAAYAAGEAIPNIINVSQVTSFGLLGGSGSTICLLIATFLIGKNAATRNVAKLSAVPGLFKINEPVLFGYPIVYNISMAIPFLVVPVVGIIISYFATVLGWMNPCVTLVPWTTPVLLSGFLATAGDWRAVIVQAVVLVLGVLIYMPFVKVNDRVMERQAAQAEEEDDDSVFDLD